MIFPITVRIERENTELDALFYDLRINKVLACINEIQ